MGKELAQIIDKSQWGDGPWQLEPDRKQWRDEATGLPCLIVRHPSMGQLCGYVGVYPGHPAYGLNYDGTTEAEAEARRKRFRKQSKMMTKLIDGGASPSAAMGKVFGEGASSEPEVVCPALANVSVHGGLTYSAPCGGHICHTPEPGEPEVWWFGFDCAHAWDLVPGMEATKRSVGITRRATDDVYRTLSYVEAECASLARQLKAMEPAL